MSSTSTMITVLINREVHNSVVREAKKYGMKKYAALGLLLEYAIEHGGLRGRW